MRRILISFASAVLLAVCNPQVVRAELMIESWRLTSGIHDFAPGAQDVQEFVTLESVQNPFLDNHFVALGSSSITSAYDISWLLDEAHFDITTSHHLAQLDGETFTSGRIYLTPSVDSLVTLSANWQFAWPNAALGSTQIGIGVVDVTDPFKPVELASATARGGNFDLGPPFGTRSVGNQTVIQAGGVYLLTYLGRVRHFDPTPPGTFGEASGDFHFTITPVPEPAAGLLALAALSPRRRPRCVPMA